MTESVTADPLLAVLTELALDLRWCWNHATDELWRRLDPELWQLTHNPWVVLQTVSRQTTRDAFADAIFRKKANQMLAEKRVVEGGPAWFQTTHLGAPLTCVAESKGQRVLRFSCVLVGAHCIYLSMSRLIFGA